jgi:hypothetical protein
MTCAGKTVRQVPKEDSFVPVGCNKGKIQQYWWIIQWGILGSDVLLHFFVETIQSGDLPFGVGHDIPGCTHCCKRLVVGLQQWTFIPWFWNAFAKTLAARSQSAINVMDIEMGGATTMVRSCCRAANRSDTYMAT